MIVYPISAGRRKPYEPARELSLDADARAKYDFTVSMAPYAISEYEHWERHDAWNGHKI
jgi:hypothetical protein